MCTACSGELLRLNHALDGFTGPNGQGGLFAYDAFSDSTSGPTTPAQPRIRYPGDYLEPSTPHETTTDRRFPGQRPKPHSASDNLAVAVIDTSAPAFSGPEERAGLHYEAAALLRAYIARATAQSVQPGAQRPPEPQMSQALHTVVAASLVGYGFTASQAGEAGSTPSWRLPFDVIATLKALVVALDPSDPAPGHSGFVRQGAISATVGGRHLAIGVSGGASDHDESTARLVAEAMRLPWLSLLIAGGRDQLLPSDQREQAFALLGRCAVS